MTLISLENIMLSERGQLQNATYGMISFSLPCMKGPEQTNLQRQKDKQLPRTGEWARGKQGLLVDVGFLFGVMKICEN